MAASMLAVSRSPPPAWQGVTKGPHGETATPGDSITLLAGEQRQGEGRQLHRRPRLAQTSELVERRQPGRRGRVRQARHRGRRRRRMPASMPPSRRATSRRCSPRSRASSSSLPVDPDDGAGGLQAGAAMPAPSSSSSTTRRQGYDTRQGLRHHPLRRSRTRWAARRATLRLSHRRQGQGRLHLPRRRFLRDQPARPVVQDDDRDGVLPT